ncbi:MAG: NHL repeat-containing protein [Deltaproteobacteria bacterium]|nr:NHL repeat-containing protein [Deltaproteobacteria bacterium]
MLSRIHHFIVFVLVLLLLLPASGFCKQKSRVKHLTSITGNKEIGQFGLLSGVFFDENKNRLYVADTTNNRILAFDSDLKFISEFTAGGALDSPTSLVRDGLGRFFVAEPGKGRVLLIDIAGKHIKPIDFSAVPKANPVHPGNMAVDSEDRLYVVDKANQRIVVFNSNMQFERQILVKDGRGLSDVKVGGGRIYALNAIDGSGCVFDAQGKRVLKFGKRGTARGEFRFPVSLAVDRKGLIYVVDQHMNKVLVFNRKGEFLFDFSQLGWREGRLHFPSYIYINSAGRIFIVDRQNARISVFE